MVAEIRESQERESNRMSLSEDVIQKYRDDADIIKLKLNLSRVVIEAIAKTDAWSQCSQMNTKVICSPWPDRRKSRMIGILQAYRKQTKQLQPPWI